MVSRLYDEDPEVHLEAEALRRQHAKPNGADVKFTPEQREEIQRLLDLNPIGRDNQIEASAENL